MQKIELNFDDSQALFCPATGKQVLCPDEPFEESPAMLFCYLPEHDTFEFSTSEIESIFKKSDEDFTKMLNKMLNQKDDYVLFELCYPRGFVSLIAFDMGYNNSSL